MNSSILFELGMVLFLGFVSALLMEKLRQPVIIGYIITGLVIGPNVLGLVKDLQLINSLSELGIVLLMFFIGLEFSLKKFVQIKNSVLFIGTYKVILDMIVGILLGGAIGLVFKEQLFLAGIITLSSSGVIAKCLFDLKRTALKESEVLMGVTLFEDFVAIAFLGILSSLATSNLVRLDVVFLSLLKTVVFFGVFIAIGLVMINHFTDKVLMRIHSQELFAALMLGTILLVGALTAKIGLASAAGAFMLGMLINSYDVETRLHRTISAFQNIFMIVFFISFGMLLDPRKIPEVLWMVAIVIPINIVAEIAFTSSASFFSGLSPKSAVHIGTGTIARGEYSLLFASLGYGLGAISENFYQFTGVYVFCMTILTPIAMKNAPLIHKGISMIIPRFLKYSGKLISLSMRPILLPEDSSYGIKIERKFAFIGIFLLYIAIVTGSFIVTKIYFLIPLCLAGLAVVFELRKLFIQKIKKTEEHFNFHEIHQGSYNLDTIARAIANLFTGFLAIVVLGASFWNFGHLVLISLLIIFIVYLLIISIHVYRKNHPKSVYPGSEE